MPQEDDFKIDTHKLMFHPDRIAEWMKGRTVCPIYLEIAPVGVCNHRCIFCAVDYLGYKRRILDMEVIKKTLKDASLLGVRSIMFAGEGEPLLHKDICAMVRFTKVLGIDSAITTNGVLLIKEKSYQLLKYLSWIRISLNAGTSKTYAKVHRTSEEDFYKVLDNIKEAVKIKNKYKHKATIGVQLLLIPENKNEVFILAKILKKLGVDYFSVKPYSQHPLSICRKRLNFKYSQLLPLGEKLKVLETSRFKIVFRDITMARLSVAKDYKRCLGLPFWAYIDSCGDVYSCSAFLGKHSFCYGNIYNESFSDIINGKRRKSIIARISSRMDVKNCRLACRLDKINSYLWELKHPGAHGNFI